MNTEVLESDVFIKKINAGNEAAFKTLFDHYYRQLCFFSNKIISDKDAAKDVVQDVFISFWNKRVAFANINALRAYLYNSVRNSSLNHIEKINNRNNINNALPKDVLTESDYLRNQLEAEVMEEIFEAIKELPDQCMNIFEMSYIQKCEVKQIAEELNISVNTVKTQRLRAKKYLKERLKNVFPILIYLFCN